MDSRLFKLDLPRETIRVVAKAMAGMRISAPPEGSIWNPFDREDKYKEICSTRIEGTTIESIAKRFNLSERHVKRILKSNGIAIKKEPKTQVEEVKALLDLGMPKRAIAKKLGISHTWLYKLIKEEGL